MTTISIHAPRTGSDRTPGTGGHHEAISIHAPRTGSDTCAYSQVYSSSDFNPRSPHGERRQSRHAFGEALHFNPRSPHGERPAPPAHKPAPRHFNPRSPHGERPKKGGRKP